MAADTAPETSYHDLDDLQTLTLPELEALWEGVPTEQQERIRRRYGQALRTKGVTDDAGELRLIDAYLERYRFEGLIPAGDKWLKISPAARQDFHLHTGEAAVLDETPTRPGSRRLVIAASVVGILMVVFLLSRLMSGGNNNETALLGTPTPSPTITLTPTATVIPTATPLALVDTDRYVSEGDRRSNRDFYPVVFRVLPPEQPARVFVVQERLVGSSEWQYEPNPDVASWVSGMLVQPVIGIPFSPENLQLFRSLKPGNDLALRMNTGAELRFRFDGLRQVGRDDTGIFSQQSPGIAVVLIGQVGSDGLPTPLRWVVAGSYLADQELDLLGGLNGLPVAMGTAGQIADLQITVLNTVFQPDSEVSDGYLNVDVNLRMEATRIANLSAYRWTLEDEYGMQVEPTNASALSPTALAAGESVETTLTFRVPRSLTGGTLQVIPPDGGESGSFIVTWETPPETVTVAALDVQIRGVARDGRSVEIDARLYNPGTEVLHLTADDVWLVSGYVPDPAGPRQTPEDFTPVDVAPEAAVDVAWRFAWNGEDPYAAFGIAGRHYTVTVIES